MLEDISYAMLNSKRICDMIISVMVGAELLFQAAASEEKGALQSKGSGKELRQRLNQAIEKRQRELQLPPQPLLLPPPQGEQQRFRLEPRWVLEA